ncbi:hypothetical protein ACFFX0_29825 [Citricoccus parietis]|uniref:Uncharacterized protein n=1 Tax=Citricoccus parietis TaxID=592307 RepID=A0ABV5G897_9MICC
MTTATAGCSESSQPCGPQWRACPLLSPTPRAPAPAQAGASVLPVPPGQPEQPCCFGRPAARGPGCWPQR